MKKLLSLIGIKSNKKVKKTSEAEITIKGKKNLYYYKKELKSC